MMNVSLTNEPIRYLQKSKFVTSKKTDTMGNVRAVHLPAIFQNEQAEFNNSR